MKQHDMWNHPNGTGLVFIKGHVPEEGYVIPELDDFFIPTKALENKEDFLSLMLQVVRMKPRHEIIFHLILNYKIHQKSEDKTIGVSFDGV